MRACRRTKSRAVSSSSTGSTCIDEPGYNTVRRLEKKARKVARKHVATGRPYGPEPYQPTEKAKLYFIRQRARQEPVDKIAAAIGICVKSLYIHFPEEMREGREFFIEKVKSKVAHRALSGRSDRVLTHLDNAIGFGRDARIEDRDEGFGARDNGAMRFPARSGEPPIINVILVPVPPRLETFRGVEDDRLWCMRLIEGRCVWEHEHRPGERWHRHDGQWQRYAETIDAEDVNDTPSER